VYESGNPSGVPIVCVHGYPDNASVWAGVAAELNGRYRVIRYDVRGAGASDQPLDPDGYSLDQLEADFHAVIDAVSPDRPVHLLAHDWGSIQGWHIITAADAAAGSYGGASSYGGAGSRVASFTSVSGPSLDHAARWLRGGLRSPRGFRPALRQLWCSYYIAAFRLPWLPERLWRSGLLDRAVATAEPGYQRSLRDRINGLQLYRVNIGGRPAARPRTTGVPVQVLAPLDDAFVTPELQLEAPRGFTRTLYLRRIPGRHWIVADQPAVIAAATGELVEAVESGVPSPSLERTRADDLTAG
jgi:pimeloyl-ACP methyl ester carboxylesterase